MLLVIVLSTWIGLGVTALVLCGPGRHRATAEAAGDAAGEVPDRTP
jgi:hypothetical protein